MKVLLVAFQPVSAMSYPHLEQVSAHLLGAGADYALFRERGYFLGDALPSRGWLRVLAERLHGWACVFADSLSLVARRLRSKPDVVVAVDNFAYAVCSRLFPRVVLWSHDFLTADVPRSRSLVQRLLAGELRRALVRQHALVIQDQERLDLFLRTYLREGEREGLRTFLMPVSVRGGEAPDARPPGARPLLLQIGGISAARSRSDELLADYQRHHEYYELGLHGFFDKEMASRVAAAGRLPWISSIPLAARDVGRVVRKCDIGLLSYNAGNDNFFHIARASGQLAEFLRCGKPVIVLGRSNLDQVLPEEGFGIAIASIDGLLPAVREIQGRYAQFSERARQAFARCYDLGLYLPALDAWLRERAGEAA